MNNWESIRGNGRWTRCPWLLCMLLFTSTACGDESDEAASCVCAGDDCPDDTCSIALTLPAACGGAATVLVDGQAAGEAAPGQAFSTCRATIGEGEGAAVSLRSSAITVEPSDATCSVGGSPAPAAYCPIEFLLGESCRGRVEEAVVVVEGEEVGTTRIDEPFSPCVLVASGHQVSGAMRAAGGLVLSHNFGCSTAGRTAQLTMECP